MVDTATEKRWDGAAWIDLTVAKRWNGSAWVDIAFPGGGGSGLSGTASTGSLYGMESRLSPPSQPAVLAVGTDSPSTVTVTASGGTGPYTYGWYHVSGDSAVQPTAATSATTGFVANVGKNQIKRAIKRCVITDSLGATFGIDVSVTLEYIHER